MADTILPLDPATNPDGGGTGPQPPFAYPDTGPWNYVQVLANFPTYPVDLQPPIIMSQRLLVEHALLDLRCPAERADLADGRRVYRVRQYFLWLVPKDQVGRYIWAGAKASTISPTGTPTMLKLYWTPTSPITDRDVIARDWVKIE